MTDENSSPLHPEPVASNTTHLRPDGTVFPPVTPDPPPPPGYVSPLDTLPDGDVEGGVDDSPTA
jgi:hypothetical protein